MITVLNVTVRNSTGKIKLASYNDGSSFADESLLEKYYNHLRKYWSELLGISVRVDLLRTENPTSVITPESYANALCELEDVKIDQLKGKSRDPELVALRIILTVILLEKGYKRTEVNKLWGSRRDTHYLKKFELHH